MTPRPIYRWKSFWLGVFVFVFLGWAWWDGYRHETMLALGRGKLQIVHGEGAIHIASGGKTTGALPFLMTHHGKAVGIWFWKRMWKSEGHSYGAIPDGVVFLLLFIPWSAVLAGRWRHLQMRSRWARRFAGRE